jgi:hypothetical protein
LNYWNVLLENYLIATGDWDIGEYSIMRKVMFYFYSLILTVVMMNLLIAVISDTYANYTVAEEEYNLR